MLDALVVSSWRRAQLAEISWLDGEGRPRITTAVPLVDGEVPCLALPYARLDDARSMAAATEVVATVATPELARGADPVAVRARARLTEDPTGRRFQDDGLLEQELAKHPPSRRRLDSLLLRREHWWYLARLLVHLEDRQRPQAIAPADGLLAVAAAGFTVAACRSEPADDDRVLHLAATPPLPDTDDGWPAVVLQHGADVPALERPWFRRWTGRLHGARLVVERYDARDPTDRPLRLVERLRGEWRLERACRAGLRAAGHH